MLQGKCRIYPESVLADINPLVFGNFIEFTHDCINQGMWAELLWNRGFEDAQEGEGVSKGWRKTGYNDTGLYTLERDTAFGHGISQKIKNVHHFGGYKGIGQKELLLQEGTEYHFSLWAKGEPAGVIKARLKDGDGAIIWQTEIKVSSEWNKYEVTGIKPIERRNAELEILLEREGSVWLDQCSLMPENAERGIWREVFQAVEESHPTVLRFPGGCFADCYSWKDGIGDRDYRPARPNKHWGGIEENNFGTDEFLELCSSLKCEPMICVNFGSADETEAAQWVEYCNGDRFTPMGRLRAKNGHPEPYHVKYWGIGNETWAEWEIGNLTADQCAEKYRRFASAMREASPERLSLIVCGGDGNSESQKWNRQVIKKTGKDAEYIDLHFYAPQLYETSAGEAQIYEATVYAAHKYEKIIRETEEIIAEHGADTRIMAGEYNAMYYNDSNREHTLEAALLNGAFLNMFIRNAGIVHIGIFSDLVNGWQGGCIRSRKGEVYRTPSYYVLWMYARAELAHSVEMEMICDTVDIAGAGHVPAMKGLPLIDSAAAADRYGNIRLFLINRHMEEPAEVNVEIRGYKAVFIIALEGEHAYSVNTYGNEQVCILKKIPEPENRIILAPHSVCMVVLEKNGGMEC